MAGEITETLFGMPKMKQTGKIERKIKFGVEGVPTG
jgi:hypothetical protein